MRHRINNPYIQKFTRLLSVLGLTIYLASCASSPMAPVVDHTPKKNKAEVTKQSSNTSTHKNGDWRPDNYVVKKGDNLLRISLELGYYYKDIAQANNIAEPYPIQVGQVLQLKSLKEKSAAEAGNASQTTTSANSNDDGVVITPINTEPVTNTTAKPVETQTVVVAISEPKGIREPYSEVALRTPLPTPKIVLENTEITKVDTSKEVSSATKPTVNTEASTNTATTSQPEEKSNTESTDNTAWIWPTKGKVIAGFNQAGNKGIDIGGTMGQAVIASAAGKVIYSGSDLRGYGKLVIIKHNTDYLSVYAHNSVILVKEGQMISKGQKIAEMGNTDTNGVKLHFEIRRQGKSVDPSKYLATN
ncbi:MAG: peptidoglycan DD-metalloendopeptidase family protein [Methylophilaceae bacterium]